MRNFYYLIIFLVLMISLYYLSILNLRNAAVSLINLFAIIFLLSNNQKVKSIIYPVFLIILLGEISIFSYEIISGFDLRNIFEFFSSSELTASIYKFKGTKIFGIDTNLYAAFFAVSAIIFKQFKRKYLTIFSFIMLFLTFSRSAILIALIILLFPSEKISLKYLYILFSIALICFLNYQGDNVSINLKISTYLLFFKSFSSLGLIEFLFGIGNIDEDITIEILDQLGGINQGHTLPGAILNYGLIYITASIVIFLILWRKHEIMRLPIFFLLTYSLFSVTAFSISTPLLIISSVFDKNYKKIQ